MLHRIFGPVGSGKRALVQEKIKEALLQGERVFVLVPEQAAAFYEYEIVENCGTLSQNAEVTNFSRLPNIVFRAFGFPKGRIPTSAEKKILLARCVFTLSDSLPLLNLKKDPESIVSLYQELEVLKRSGLTPDVLSTLSEKDFSSPDLGPILSETATLFAAYHKAGEGVFRDPSDEGEHLLYALEKEPFFKDSYVFIDGFWDFTYMQEKIIGRIFSQAKEVTVSFAGVKGKRALFEKPLKAAERLLRMARQQGIDVRDTTLEKKGENTALSFLCEHFGEPSSPFEGEIENISLYACKNSIDEALLAAEKVLSLVQKGAKWNEIAILSRDGAVENLLSLTLKEKGIPHFCEEKQSLSHTPLAQTVLLACKLALGQGEEGEVRTYIKNGVFRASEEKRFALENYVATWSIEKRRILSPVPFYKSPDGYFEMRDRGELDFVNLAKEEIFGPLIALSQSLCAELVREKVEAILSHLACIGAEEVLLARVKQAKEEKDFEKAALYLGTWNSLLSALSALARTLGEEAVSTEEFMGLLTLALSDDMPGALPPGQDRVQIGRVDFARPEKVKYVILLGLTAGVFPAPEGKGGLFKKGQKEELRALGFSLPGSEEDLSQEYFYFYLAASFGEKELILSYSTAEGESETGALSVIGKQVMTLLPKLTPIPFRPEEHLPQTKEEAFSLYLSLLGSDTKEEEILSEYFLSLPEYKERVLSATAALADQNGRDHLTREMPYKGKDMGMVYSRLEKYTLCPFSYFARYLLLAKSREKAVVNPAVAGSFVHKVLELVLSALGEEGRDLTLLTSEELKEETKKAVKTALSEIGAEEGSGSLSYLILRLEESCVLILENLKEEFSQTDFRPIFFEKELSDLDGVYKVPLSDGTNLCFYGSIDRVDQYTAPDGTRFVRVVDYKTGGHDFSLTDVGNGLSLQMLLYLFALWNQGYTYKGEKVSPLPAGVVYLNGLSTPKVCENKEEIQALSQDPFESLSREGLLVEDMDLLTAQEKEGQGKYIPVAFGKTRKSGAANLVSLERLGKLKKKVEKDYMKLAENLKAGNIEAAPLTGKSKNLDPCKYCEYLPICKRKEEDRKPYRSRISKEEIFGEVEA